MNKSTSGLLRTSRRVTLTALITLATLLTGMAMAETAPATPPVRNVILFIADGCGFNHLTAAGMYLTGKPDSLPFQSFPVRGAMATFPAGGYYNPVKLRSTFKEFIAQATDSAAAATAMATGVKTKNGRIGIGADGAQLTNVMEKAKDAGKRTGVVTSVPWSHATPAGFVTHDNSRNAYEVIASQMLFQSEMDVIMGCGHPTPPDYSRTPSGSTNTPWPLSNPSS